MEVHKTQPNYKKETLLPLEIPMHSTENFLYLAKLPFTCYVSIVNYVGMSAIKKYVHSKKVYKCNYNAWKIMALSRLVLFTNFN